MNAKRLRIIAVVAIIGWVYAAYDFYEFNSSSLRKMRKAKRHLTGKLNKEKEALKGLQDFAKNIELIKEELHALNLQLESALEYMPPDFQLAGVLRQLTNLAQNAGVKIYSFKPEKRNGKTSQANGNFYEAIRIRSELEGSFTQVLVFLDQLSRLKRVVNVDELKIDTSKKVERTGNVRVKTAALLKTYRFSQ